MAAIGMGNVLIGMFCMAFCFGLNGTLESKVSMAYGSKDYEMCALWLNRGRMINTFLMLPIAVLFFQSGNILKSIGQDEEVADMAAQFTIYLIPGTWAMVQFDATKRFCTSQFKAELPFYTQLFTTILHVISCFYFIQYLDLKMFGAAITLNLTYFLNMVILDLWISQS